MLDGRSAVPVKAPSKATIWRVVTGADPAAVDAVVGAWLADLARLATAGGCDGPGDGTDEPGMGALAVDGKTVSPRYGGVTDAGSICTE